MGVHIAILIVVALSNAKKQKYGVAYKDMLICYRYGHAEAYLAEAERISAGSRGASSRPLQVVPVKKAWAEVFLLQNKYSNALEYLEEASALMLDELGGKPDIQLAEIYRSMANIHERNGDKALALECHLQACGQYSALGTNSFDAADSSHKIGKNIFRKLC